MAGIDRVNVVEVLRRHGASFAFVHGSVAAGTAKAGSDLDVAAWFAGADPAPWDVGVDLPSGVDLLVLDSAPLELAGRVAQYGEVLFDDDPPARVRWLSLTRRMWFDEQPRTERSRRTFAEGARRRG